VVVPREEGVNDPADIARALADKLARFKQPRQILFIAELPKNAMGKVQKAELHDRHAKLFTASWHGTTPLFGGTERAGCFCPVP